MIAKYPNSSNLSPSNLIHIKQTLRKTLTIAIIIVLISSTLSARAEECQDGCNHCNIWRTECYECSPGWGQEKDASKDPLNPDLVVCKKCSKSFCQNCLDDIDVCYQCDSTFHTQYKEAPNSTNQVANCVPCRMSLCLQCVDNANICTTCQNGLSILEDGAKCGLNNSLISLLLIVAGVIMAFIFCFFCMKNQHMKGWSDSICKCCESDSSGTLCCCGTSVVCGLCSIVQSGNCASTSDSCSTCELSCCMKSLGSICLPCSDCSCEWINRD